MLSRGLGMPLGLQRGNLGQRAQGANRHCMLRVSEKPGGRGIRCMLDWKLEAWREGRWEEEWKMPWCWRKCSILTEQTTGARGMKYEGELKRCQGNIYGERSIGIKPSQGSLSSATTFSSSSLHEGVHIPQPTQEMRA